MGQTNLNKEIKEVSITEILKTLNGSDEVFNDIKKLKKILNTDILYENKYYAGVFNVKADDFKINKIKEGHLAEAYFLIDKIRSRFTGFTTTVAVFERFQHNRKTEYGKVELRTEEEIGRYLKETEEGLVLLKPKLSKELKDLAVESNFSTHYKNFYNIIGSGIPRYYQKWSEEKQKMVNDYRRGKYNQGHVAEAFESHIAIHDVKGKYDHVIDHQDAYIHFYYAWKNKDAWYTGGDVYSKRKSLSTQVKFMGGKAGTSIHFASSLSLEATATRLIQLFDILEKEGHIKTRQKKVAKDLQEMLFTQTDFEQAILDDFAQEAMRNLKGYSNLTN